MNRRKFIQYLSLGSAAGLALRPAGNGAWAFGMADETAKLSRISISTWTFHNYFASTREKEFNLPGDMLALLDFPGMIAGKYKVHNLEFCAPHFASTDTAYLKELKARLDKAGSKVING